MTEARFEIAAEEAEPSRRSRRPTRTTRQSEAEALIRQMKAEFGDGPRLGGLRRHTRGSGPVRLWRPSAPSGASGKTIGRTPSEPDAPDDAETDRGAKSIGRTRDQ